MIVYNSFSLYISTACGMPVLVRSIRMILAYLSVVYNHKPGDAGKQYAVLHKKRAVGFLPHPPSTYFSAVFFSTAIGCVAGALACKK